MSHKVIHISDEVHAASKAHCTKQGLLLKDWAENALLSTIEREDPTQRPAHFVQVGKKPLQAVGESREDDGIKPWELPPFWERGGVPQNPEDNISGEVQVRTLTEEARRTG